MHGSVTNEVLHGVETLRTLDPGFQHFGAKAHRYAFNLPLNEGAINEVESKYRIALPPD